MFQKGHFINLISLSIIGIISGLYVFKYSAVYYKLPGLITAVYLLVFFIFILSLDKINLNQIFFINKRFFIFVTALLVFDAFCWVTFVPRIGQVGRLPAIVDWLHRFFSAEFPYNSPYTPSGFPFLFFLSIPFYFIKKVGYLEIFGLLFFSYWIINSYRTNKETVFKIIIPLLSPVIYYELAVRGELFANMMLAITAIFLAEKYFQPGELNLRFFLFAILFGLVLSTRSVVGLVYAIYFLYLFRFEIPKGIIFTLSVSIVFGLTLLPFIIWDPHSFFHNGPFAIQSFLSYLPIWVIFIFLILSIYASWSVGDIQDVFFASGLMLFLPVLLSMIIKIIQHGFYNAVVNDIFDLSYFVFCVPFFVFALKDYIVNKFLGKVLV